MFLVSWNVAGWASTAGAIAEQFGSIRTYLTRLGADIVCLQESKGAWKKLEEMPRELGVGRDMADDWEAFWSFSKNLRGFNGVVTFARKGLTWKCDPRPFTDDALNDEGRVVVTYHSHFVLINVYVVNARAGLRTDYKVYFLESLCAVMSRLREETKLPLILAGDLNMTYRPQDAHWTFRRIDLQRLAQLEAELQRCDTHVGGSPMCADVNLPRPALTRMVRLVVDQLHDQLLDESASLGGGDAAEEGGSASSPMKSISCDDNFNKPVLPGVGSAAAAEMETRVAATNALRLKAQHMARSDTTWRPSIEEFLHTTVCTVHADSLTRPSPAHNAEVFALVKAIGLPAHATESQVYMNRLLEKMVDTFLLERSGAGGSDAESESGAHCPCPYTCWDQSKNKRLVNEGSRIDYILADKELAAHVVPRGFTPNNTGIRDGLQGVGGGNASEWSEEKLTAAIRSDAFSEMRGVARTLSVRRAMAAGLYDSAPSDGSGLPPLSAAAASVQFNGLPSTGLFVTPPQFSDHIGVCLEFRSGFELQTRAGKLEEVSKCMYRPPGRDIRSFFGPKAGTTTLATLPTKKPRDAAPEPVQPPPQLEQQQQQQQSVLSDIPSDSQLKRTRQEDSKPQSITAVVDVVDVDA